MKPTLFLRIASVLTFLFCAGHTIGGVFGNPAPGVQAFVVQTMKANAFDAMGAGVPGGISTLAMGCWFQ